MVEQNPYAAEEAAIPVSAYQKDTNVLMLDLEHEYSVANPQDISGSIHYEVKGKDRAGLWEGKRRYNEFFLLSECLNKRFPGVPLPILPEKQAFGNKDIIFLRDRTFYLQRYLRKLARFDFILESPEFQLFSRPQGLNISKALEKLMPMST
jgi:hypothetical protein